MKKLTTAINYLLGQPDELPCRTSIAPKKPLTQQIIHMHDTVTFTCGALRLLETEMLLLS